MKAILCLTFILTCSFASAEDKMMEHGDQHMMSNMQDVMSTCMTKTKDNKKCKAEMLKACEEKMDKKQCEDMVKKMDHMGNHEMHNMKM